MNVNGHCTLHNMFYFQNFFLQTKEEMSLQKHPAGACTAVEQRDTNELT